MTATFHHNPAMPTDHLVRTSKIINGFRAFAM